MFGGGGGNIVGSVDSSGVVRMWYRYWVYPLFLVEVP